MDTPERWVAVYDAGEPTTALLDVKGEGLQL